MNEIINKIQSEKKAVVRKAIPTSRVITIQFKNISLFNVNVGIEPIDVLKLPGVTINLLLNQSNFLDLIDLDIIELL